MPNRTQIIYGLFFASGALGLIYEVLWLKELQLLFGNSAYATATTLSVFFLGLGAGGYYWGRRSTSVSNLLRAYGLLEIGIGITAILYFGLLALYRTVYAPLFEMFGNTAPLFVLAKFVLSLTILFLPAFLMGGTLPILSQHFVRRPRELGKTGTLLYAVNLAGAVVGVMLAGFVLPPLIGYRLSYVGAIISSGLIGFLAVLLGRGAGPAHRFNGALNSGEAEKEGNLSLTSRWIYLFAFFSGYLALALQVLWTRMFSQVLQNTVYTFSMILIVFLVALALGAAVANLISRTRVDPAMVLIALLTLTGLACSMTPGLFHDVTNGLDRLVSRDYDHWMLYLAALFGKTASVILVPGILLGSVFPYLIKSAESMKGKAGPIIGRLLSVNTVGAISGSLSAGFFMLGQWGLWKSLKVISLNYLALALLIPLAAVPGRRRHLAWPIAILAFLLFGSAPGDRLPLVHLPSDGTQELVAVIEGSHATASVVKYTFPGQEAYAGILLNNKYSLGGTKPLFVANQKAQTVVPLSLHPDAKSIFYLGMGTGITAEEALNYDVEKVTVCELVPEVVEAARLYLPEYVGRLFHDPRATVIIEDGRNYLLGRREKYDLIIGDLFLPWKAGIGNLYSVEHFATVQSKLKEHGLFVQWLALYQLSRREFFTIVNTMLQVFEEVTFWRSSFLADRPTMALIGHLNPSPLKTENLTGAFLRLNQGEGNIPTPMILANTLMLYAGNLKQSQGLFAAFPVNTDDRPRIEFSSPQSYQHRMAGTEQALIEQELVGLLEDVFHEAPPEKDPYLKAFDPEAKGYARAGLYLYRMSASARTDRVEAKRHLSAAIEKLPPEFGRAVEAQAGAW